MLKLLSASVTGTGTVRRYEFTLSDGSVAKTIGAAAAKLKINQCMIENTVDRYGIDKLVEVINTRPAAGNGKKPTKVVGHRQHMNYTLYIMDNGQELKSGQIAKMLGITSIHAKRVLDERGEAGLNAMLTGEDEGFDPIEEKEFPRGRVCIKKQVECKRYRECVDARLEGDNWQKPEGECYEAAERKPLSSYRSPMANIEMYCIGMHH